MPRTVIAGNWKMHKTAVQTRAFLDAFLPHVGRLPRTIDIVIAPPFTSLPEAHRVLSMQSRVRLGAQTMHWAESGAYTGEISPPMLRELGVSYVIIGHSERRMYCNESDRTINLKTVAALAHGITPIIAVGETLDERESGMTDARVIAQTRAALDGIAPADLTRVIVAYEPIWAIGTGRSCDAGEADRVMGAIRGCVPALESVSILYGGSMKGDNVAAYLAQPNINGGLVGGASLEPDAFATLIANAVAR